MATLRPQGALGLCESWILHLEAENYKPKSRKNYRAAVESYIAFLASKRCAYDRVTYEILDEWLIHLVKVQKLVARSANVHISAVRSWYKWLKRRGYVYELLLAETKMLKAPRLLPKPFTEDEIEKFLAAAVKPLDRALIEVFYASGGRISELHGMNLEDLHLDRGEILCMGKNSRERILLLGPPAVDAVRAWLDFRRRRGDDMSPGRPLWIGKKRGRLDLKTIRKHVRQVAEAAGITGRIHPHRFRHAAATHMLNHGADLRAVQEMLGHANIASTQIYTQVATDRLRDSHRRAHPRG